MCRDEARMGTIFMGWARDGPADLSYSRVNLQQTTMDQVDKPHYWQQLACCIMTNNGTLCRKQDKQTDRQTDTRTSSSFKAPFPQCVFIIIGETMFACFLYSYLLCLVYSTIPQGRLVCCNISVKLWEGLIQLFSQSRYACMYNVYLQRQIVLVPRRRLNYG